jgi:hypothetical protein
MRIMALYFIQGKGFLGGDPHYLSHRLQSIEARQDDRTFYHDFLLPLCHERLGRSPHSQSERAIHAPPGENLDLNLHIFSSHRLERGTQHIQVADEAFAQLFALFDTYQWQLDEHAPVTQNTLFPGILSYVCERQMAQKQIGAYYTKQDVTQYIARNTIIPFLFNAVAETHPQAFRADADMWQLVRASPDRYIRPALQQDAYLAMESKDEHAARGAYYIQLRARLAAGAVCSITNFITYNLDIQRFAQDVIERCESMELLRDFYTTIEHITMLDPTCGSGAFLLAALDVLEALSTCCLERLHTPGNACPDFYRLDSVTRSPLRHSIRRSIVSQNLYGIDIMEQAADVCALRLFLRLLASAERVEDAQFPMGAHVRQGNALVGTLRPRGVQSPERAFSWWDAFPDVLARGGFDVIIGNPPYVEYSKVKQHYRVHGYEETSYGNLYAAVIERSLELGRPRRAYIGLIAPLSICGGLRFGKLRETITRSTSSLWLANFDIFPCRLFADAFQRLSIVIARHDAGEPCHLHVTAIQRWYSAERPRLFDTIRYTPVQHTAMHRAFPKLASARQEVLLEKLHARARGDTIATLLSPQRTDHFVYYQESTNYWIKALCHTPYHSKNGVVVDPPHGRYLFLEDDLSARVIMALMNSSLFYLWFATYADGFHLSHTLVKDFPIGHDLRALKALSHVATRLEQSITTHARTATRNTRQHEVQRQERVLIDIEQYSMGRSKAILDEIDGFLAHYYGFTQEEMEFVIHYDGKYRMGQRL